MILNHAPLIAFAWVMLLESVIVAIGLFAFYIKYVKSVHQWSASFRRAKSLLHDSSPLILSGLALMVQARIDQVMLAKMVSDIEVGYYSAALRIIETAAVSAMILKSSFQPTLINDYRQKTVEFYKSRLMDFYRLNFLIAMSIGLPVAMLSHKIISVLFGVAYQPAGILLMLMSLRLFFAHIGVARSVFLLNENMFKYSSLTMVVGTITNVALNFVLIPPYQGVGAVVASLISFAITTCVLDLFYGKCSENNRMMWAAMMTSYRLLLGRK